jgi:hypothetical protein
MPLSLQLANKDRIQHKHNTVNTELNLSLFRNNITSKRKRRDSKTSTFAKENPQFAAELQENVPALKRVTAPDDA